MKFYNYQNKVTIKVISKVPLLCEIIDGERIIGPIEFNENSDRGEYESFMGVHRFTKSPGRSINLYYKGKWEEYKKLI